jgi:hypothetical protein
MKRIVTLALALAAIAAFGAAADKPNFSGDWTVDLTKSDFGPIPPPSGMTRKVDHKDPAVTVVETQTGGPQGDMTVTSKYSTDGKETTNELMGSQTKSTAKWDGSALVVATNADFQGTAITLTDKWTLSDDGKVTTIARHIATGQGDFDVIYVLNKK